MTPHYHIDASDPDDVLVTRLDELCDDPAVIEVVVDRIMDDLNRA